MKVEIYQDIKSKLESVSGVKYVGLWNDQITRGHKMTLLPAVFVEFHPVTYEDMNNYIQEADDLRFILHIVQKITKDNDTQLMQLSQDIYKALQQSYSRVSETPAHGFESIADYMVEFSTRIEDEDAKPDTQTTTKPDLNIDKQMQSL